MYCSSSVTRHRMVISRSRASSRAAASSSDSRELRRAGVAAGPLPQSAHQLLVDLGLAVAVRLQIEGGPAADRGSVPLLDLHALE
jgi:hypothetical protein